MTAVTLETPRLILRTFQGSDLEALVPIMGDAEVQKFSKFGVEDRAGIQKFLKGVQAREERDGVTQYAVILRETQELIGDCGIMVQQVDGSPEFEIGYKLARKFWGHGYATEAAIACRNYGIKAKGIRRFVSIIDPANIASARVAQKVGMSLEKRSLYWDSMVDIYSLKVDGQ